VPSATSYPLTISLWGTSLPSFGQIRLCSIRAPSSRCTSWKWTDRSSVAEWTLTGTKTPAKAIVPFQIERSAMTRGYPAGRS
jgi:hypothetical protein